MSVFRANAEQVASLILQKLHKRGLGNAQRTIENAVHRFSFEVKRVMVAPSCTVCITVLKHLHTVTISPIVAVSRLSSNHTVFPSKTTCKGEGVSMGCRRGYRCLQDTDPPSN